MSQDAVDVRYHKLLHIKSFQCWNWPKRTGRGVRSRNVWNFAQGLKFKAHFHSKMSVCRHELGVEPPPPDNSNPESFSCVRRGEWSSLLSIAGCRPLTTAVSIYSHPVGVWQCRQNYFPRSLVARLSCRTRNAERCSEHHRKLTRR